MLCEKNRKYDADCIGWLKIDGTDISYPVVQGKDNEFYLHHDFQKNYAICGTLMLDCRNDIDAEQEHLIIYTKKHENSRWIIYRIQVATEGYDYFFHDKEYKLMDGGVSGLSVLSFKRIVRPLLSRENDCG